jgi:hypothetical protein
MKRCEYGPRSLPVVEHLKEALLRLAPYLLANIKPWACTRNNIYGFYCTDSVGS